MCTVGGAPGTGLGRASASPGTTPRLSVRIYIWLREFGKLVKPLKSNI